MNVTLSMYLIVCPLVFLAAVVDASVTFIQALLPADTFF